MVGEEGSRQTPILRQGYRRSRPLPGADFLTYRRLIRPLVPTNKVPTFSKLGMGWGMYEKQRATSLPSAEARLWQSENGSLAVVIANHVNEEISFAYAVNPSEYGFGAGELQISEITPKDIGDLEVSKNTIKRTETLSPRQLKIIVIRPR